MQFHRITQENVQRVWNKVFKIHQKENKNKIKNKAGRVNDASG